MTGLAVTGLLGFLLIAAVLWLTAAGFRSGDRSGDATVSAIARSVVSDVVSSAPSSVVRGAGRDPGVVDAGVVDAGQADEPRPVIIARVRNPGTVPVLAGLRARPSRIPGWLRPGVTVTVRHTSRRITGQHIPGRRIFPWSTCARRTSAWNTCVRRTFAWRVGARLRLAHARRYNPDAFAAVGVVDAGQAASFVVPVPAAARRYRLTVVVGQSRQRLRVLRLTVPAAGRPARVGWPDRGDAGRRAHSYRP